MQDAVQYGAVEASSPPTPPKRFGRKTVVALAALGLAGVAALSLGPTKKTATGLATIDFSVRSLPRRVALIVYIILRLFFASASNR